MEVEGAEVPLCDSCGHRHILGIRCAICGHVGKSQIFAKMRQKSSDGRGIKIDHVDGGTALPYSGVVEEVGQLQIVTQLRIQIARDLSLPLADVIDSKTDHMHHHVLVSVGDLPVATTRWRYYHNESGMGVLSVDQVMSSAEYRRRGFVYRCLYDILTSVKQSGVTVSVVELQVPFMVGSEWIGEKMGGLGFRVVPADAAHTWCGLPVYSMILDVSAPHVLDSMVTYLLQKTSIASV